MSEYKIYGVQLFMSDCDFSTSWIHFVSDSEEICDNYCKRLNDLNSKICTHEADQSFKFKETYDYSRLDYWCSLNDAITIEIKFIKNETT